MNYFEVAMKFTAEVDGKTKRQTAKFLIETETFGDSEQKAFAELGNNERDAVCHSITRSNVTEVLKIGDGGKWYKVFYTTITTDESGKEKKAKFVLLVDAETVVDAAERAADHLGNDATINKIDDGKFLDVLEYVKATDNAPATFRPKTINEPFSIDQVRKAGNVLIAAVDPTNGQAVPFDAYDEYDTSSC